VRRLNIRFAQGSATNNLATAGVLVHNFDQPHSRIDAWNIACMGSPWCSSSSDRWSASLINPSVPWLYSNKGAGFVLSADVVNRGGLVSCAWSEDGGTKRITCDTPSHSASCIPGCATDTHQWCEERRADALLSGVHDCPWRPDQLGAMIAQHEWRLRQPPWPPPRPWIPHNEVILDSRAWNRSLPSLVEAIFFNDNRSATFAARVRARFLAAFRLDPADVPLTRLRMRAHPSATKVEWPGSGPFELVDAMHVLESLALERCGQNCTARRRASRWRGLRVG